MNERNEKKKPLSAGKLIGLLVILFSLPGELIGVLIVLGIVVGFGYFWVSGPGRISTTAPSPYVFTKTRVSTTSAGARRSTPGTAPTSTSANIREDKKVPRFIRIGGL